ncbi:MAG: sigma-70 family RNA polymerase sigma factor [Acidimicrobiales bacterium]|nr:sigma-70 family RNA polymerase sigma factor [Acidimicrobiales bacterium]
MNDWTALALQARDGDQLAAEAFIRASQQAVLDVCRHLGDPDNADDLAQEVYVRALRSLPRFRNDGSARAWLMTIARNTCADAVRSRSRRRLRISPAELPDPGVPDRSGTVDNDLLLAALSPERREAMVLTQLVGLSYADAARVIGVPIGTVRSRVARARGDLLEALREPDNGEVSADGG